MIRAPLGNYRAGSFATADDRRERLRAVGLRRTADIGHHDRVADVKSERRGDTKTGVPLQARP